MERMQVPSEANPVGFDSSRRGFFGASAVALALGTGALLASRPASASGDSDFLIMTGWLHVKLDCNAVGDGITDDTAALQGAINRAASERRPLFLPPGTYRISSALNVPTNTTIVGSGHMLGFGCTIRVVNCAAFVIGGATAALHIRIQDLTIEAIHTGGSVDSIISIDNSYSVVIQNVRINEIPPAMIDSGAVVKLLGHSSVGGHGKCNGIIWDNLVVRNINSMPELAVRATYGCGTHRFLCPSFEGYKVLFNWEGGAIDWFAPYTEGAGVNAVNCVVNTEDAEAAFTSHGGLVQSAPSGVACAIRANTPRFDSFGTRWVSPAGGSGGWAAYLYGIPRGPVTFHGIHPNVSGPNVNGLRESLFSGGFTNWERAVRFPDYSLRGSKPWSPTVPPNGQQSTTLVVDGIRPGKHWARAAFSTSAGTCQISAHVFANDTVEIIAQNNAPVASAINNATVYVDAGWI